jgi:hypothetical protein
VIIQFDPFYIEYPEITEPVGDFRSECVLAATKAVSKNIDNLPIVVMMSGGIDSELVGEALLLANIPFKVVIGRLVTRAIDTTNPVIFNQHDYFYAERWCRKNNISVIYCDIDVYKDADILCQNTLSSCGVSPQYACHMYIMKWCKDNRYFFIAGNGEMDIVLYEEIYCMMEEQTEFTLHNFQLLHGISGVFQFWKQDARLVAAFLQLNKVKQYISQRAPRILDYKHECFADAFKSDTRTKQTGFEKLREWDHSLRKPMKDINGHFANKYYIPITHFEYKGPLS